MTQSFAKCTSLIALIATLLFSMSSWGSIVCKLTGPTVNYKTSVTLTLSNTVNVASTQLNVRTPSLYCLLGANPQAFANAFVTSGHTVNGYGEINTRIPGVAIQVSLGASNWKHQVPYVLNNTVSGLKMQDVGIIFISVINRTPGSLANYTGKKSDQVPIFFRETRQKRLNATNVWVTLEGMVNVTINLDIDNDGGTGGGGTGGSGSGGGGTGGSGAGAGIQSCSLATTPSTLLNFGDLRLDQLDGLSVQRTVALKVACSSSYPPTRIPVRIVSTFGGTSTIINSSKKEIGIKMTDDFIGVTGHGAVFQLIKDYWMIFGFSPIRNDGPLGSVEGLFSAGVVFEIVVP